MPLTLSIAAQIDGWTPSGEVWTRTGNSTFTIPGDVTAKYVKGTKIKVTDTTTKYGVVASSSFGAGVTTVTLITTTSYLLVANPTASWYSYQENPVGFPTSFSWTEGYTGFSANPASPTFVRWWTKGNTITVDYHNTNVGTSNATTFTMTGLPVAPAVAGNQYFLGFAADASSLFNTARGDLSGTTLSVFKDAAASAWTASASKGLFGFTLSYVF